MKKTSFNIFAVIITFVSIILLLLICPWFNIVSVEITGLENIEKQAVLKDLNLTGNDVNLFAFNTFKAKKILYSNQYVESVKIKKQIPNRLVINVTERKIKGYIPYMIGKYLYIDDEGRIIDIQSSYIKPLPVVVGLKFNDFTLGEVLEVENKEAFNIVVELAKLMNKYEILEYVIKVDVSKPDDIHLYVKNIDVLFGDFTDANWKISTLNEIINKFSADNKGFLDLSDSKKTPTFRYLT